MTGRGLVTTQAGLPGDSALLSSRARPREAGTADLAAGLGPDLACCVPTSCRPGPADRKFWARLPPPLREGVAAAAPRAGAEVPPDWKTSAETAGRTPGLKASEGKLRLLVSCKATKFP